MLDAREADLDFACNSFRIIEVVHVPMLIFDCRVSGRCDIMFSIDNKFELMTNCHPCLIALEAFKKLIVFASKPINPRILSKIAE